LAGDLLVLPFFLDSILIAWNSCHHHLTASWEGELAFGKSVFQRVGCLGTHGDFGIFALLAGCALFFRARWSAKTMFDAEQRTDERTVAYLDLACGHRGGLPFAGQCAVEKFEYACGINS
jgi:hypothetical protein